MSTDDERFEQYLREAAADYEAPRGDVPRDEMWAAIQARRGASSVAPMSRRPRTWNRWAWVGGMAATLLVGVGIGRFAFRGRTPAPIVASAPSNTESSTTPSKAPVLAVQPLEHAAPLPANPATSPYAVASARHLQSVQLLLTSYAANDSTARSDSLLAVWARDLLSNTRLLLDSPAARDPQRARLLEDLEVILVQLVQHAPGESSEERSAIERTLRKTQIIPRLRSALPASLHSATD